MANTMWAIVAVLLWVVELLVWWTLIPLIVHSLGIRLPLWRYPSTAALGLWQAVFVETLKVGVGFWLLHATTDCIACHFEYRFLVVQDSRFLAPRFGGVRVYCGSFGRINSAGAT